MRSVYPVVQRQAEEADEERQPTPPIQPFLVQRCGGEEPCGCGDEPGGACGRR